MWDVLHWLPYPHRIAYRVSALVRCCIKGITLHTYKRSFAPPCKSSAAAISAQLHKLNLLSLAHSLCHQAELCLLCCWPCDLEWVFDHTSSNGYWSLHLFLHYSQDRSV